MSPLTSLTWSDGSDYIYGINGTITNGLPTGNTVSIYIMIYDI